MSASKAPAPRSVPEQLQARLSDQLGWEVALPQRTYAGRRMLEEFCVSWSAREGIKPEVSSIYTMTVCLKAKKLDITWQRKTFCWDVVPIND